MAKILVELKQLDLRAAEMLIAAGVSPEDADIVIQNLREAEICGPESHGYIRLPAYLERIRKGLINTRPVITIEEKSDVILQVDGGNGLGQVVTMQTLLRCMEIARDRGLCIAFIRNSNHFGTCGYYTRLAARQGLVALVSSNASASMPPFGGIDNILGTNPFSLSFPAGKYDNFTLDIALTAAAKGKIRLYEKMGKELPLGWAMDKDGNDTTDPTAAIAGGLLPMGGHKGYGLAMIVDLFCGIMSGASLSQEIESMFSATAPAGVGHFIAVLDPTRLLSSDQFTARVEAWFDDIKSSKTRNGVDRILFPGELENERASAVPTHVELLEKTARDLGLLKA